MDTENIVDGRLPILLENSFIMRLNDKKIYWEKRFATIKTIGMIEVLHERLSIFCNLSHARERLIKLRVFSMASKPTHFIPS